MKHTAHEFEARRKPMRPAAWAALAAALLVAACGGGGGGGNNQLSPDEVMANLATKVNVPGATVSKITGTPPSAAANPAGSDGQEPVVTGSVVNGVRGQKVTLPVSVELTNTLNSLFAKVPGASSYFEATFAGGKALKDMRFKSAFAPTGVKRAKVLVTIDFEVDLPASFPTGPLCFEFSARDSESLTSEVEQICILVTASPSGTPSPSPSPSPSPTPGPGTGKATDCLNADLYAVGNRLDLVQQATFDGEVSTLTQEFVPMRQTTFNGNSATEVAGSFTVESGGEVTSVESVNQYLRVDGSTLLFFGATFEETVDGSTVSGEVTFDPAIESRLDLSPGQNYSQTYTSSGSSTVDGETFEFSDTVTSQTTYVGQESITVPAGTFDACRFSEVETISGQSFGATFWFAVNSGVPLRTLFDDGEDIVLTSASINGAPVTGN